VKISVVTVSFNGAATLRRCIESVAKQTYPGVEHIVIDGGSRDGTAEIVKQCGGRIAQFVSEPDDGIYDAMNKGISLSTGDYIGFLNADDEFASDDSLSLVAQYLRAGRKDIAYGDLTYVRASDASRIVRTWRAGAYSRGRLRFGWMPPHPTFYISRSLIQQVGDFEKSLRIAADYDFMLRSLLLAGDSVTYVPKILVRMRTGGISNNSLRSIIRKSREDLLALRRNRVGGWLSLVSKNFRKVPQFLGT
jgi:glycosyltransferase